MNSFELKFRIILRSNCLPVTAQCQDGAARPIGRYTLPYSMKTVLSCLMQSLCVDINVLKMEQIYSLLKF